MLVKGPMTNSRRDFLGQVACAFAVAGIPCRIPAAVLADQSLSDDPKYKWFLSATGRLQIYKNYGSGWEVVEYYPHFPVLDGMIQPQKVE